MSIAFYMRVLDSQAAASSPQGSHLGSDSPTLAVGGGSDPKPPQRTRRRLHGSRASSASTRDAVGPAAGDAAAALNPAAQQGLRQHVAEDDVPGVAGSVTDGITRAAGHNEGVLVCQCGRVLISRVGTEDARGLEGRAQAMPSAQPTALISLQDSLPQLSLPSILLSIQPAASSTVQQKKGDASQLALHLHHARIMQSSLQLLAEGTTRIAALAMAYLLTDLCNEGPACVGCDMLIVSATECRSWCRCFSGGARGVQSGPVIAGTAAARGVVRGLLSAAAGRRQPHGPRRGARQLPAVLPLQSP